MRCNSVRSNQPAWLKRANRVRKGSYEFAGLRTGREAFRVHITDVVPEDEVFIGETRYVVIEVLPAAQVLRVKHPREDSRGIKAVDVLACLWRPESLVDEIFDTFLEAFAACRGEVRWEPWGPPDDATGLEPGSSEKIKLMKARLAEGVELHHPNDRRHEIDMTLLEQFEASRDSK